MAAFTLNRPQVFPDETVVGAYPKANWLIPDAATGAPIGEPDEEATVSGDLAAFTELEPNTEYWLVGEVDGAYHYIAILTSAPPEVTGARDEPEGALKSLLSVLEGAGLITDATTES